MGRHTGPALPRSLNDEATEVRATADHLAGKLRGVSANLHDHLFGPRKEDGAPEAPPYRDDCLEGAVHGTAEALAKIARTIDELSELALRIGVVEPAVNKAGVEEVAREHAMRGYPEPTRPRGERYG
jgi:hypothetical protein